MYVYSSGSVRDFPSPHIKIYIYARTAYPCVYVLKYIGSSACKRAVMKRDPQQGEKEVDLCGAYARDSPWMTSDCTVSLVEGHPTAAAVSGRLWLVPLLIQ